MFPPNGLGLHMPQPVQNVQVAAPFNDVQAAAMIAANLSTQFSEAHRVGEAYNLLLEAQRQYQNFVVRIRKMNQGETAADGA